MKNNLPRFIGNMEVSPIGLGCMPLSGYPPVKSFMLDNRDQAIQTIHTALDAGINFLDTGDSYSPTWAPYGHNEKLIAQAIRSWNGSVAQKAKIIIATKAGLTREKNDTWYGELGYNSTRSYLYRAVEGSAARLGVDKIKLWQHHRVDPKLTIHEQYENVNTLKEHGIVENIGLSNVTLAQLKVALSIIGGPKDGGVVSVQNEFSPRFRVSSDVLELCTELGIAFLPWSPLGGIGKPENVTSNTYANLHEMANRKNVSVFALTIAWHLAKSPITIPIPGSSQPSTILDSLSASEIDLSIAEFAELENGLPITSIETGTYVPKKPTTN
jgi:aryl-alcohol dehydrogenase-like predicted oxidoreductase